MIVVCPACSAPFELEPGSIAPLLQVACPSCSFKMILDFAAANDPSLVEAGTASTSGFLSKDDYWTAMGESPAAASGEVVVEQTAPTAGTPIAEAVAVHPVALPVAPPVAATLPAPAATAPAIIAPAVVATAAKTEAEAEAEAEAIRSKRTMIATRAVVPGQAPVRPASAASVGASARAGSASAAGPAPRSTSPARASDQATMAMPSVGGAPPSIVAAATPTTPSHTAPEVEEDVDLDEEFGDSEHSQPVIVPAQVAARAAARTPAQTQPPPDLSVTEHHPQAGGLAEPRQPPHSPPTSPPPSAGAPPAPVPTAMATREPHPAELSHAGAKQSPAPRRRSALLPVLVVGVVLIGAALAAAFALGLI